MSLSGLLADMTRLGVRLEVRGDALRYHPRSVVTPDLAEGLKAHKAELLALLRPAATGPDVATVWQAALDWLAGDPLFPPDVIEAMRAANVRWADVRLNKEAPAILCPCGAASWRDVPIHGGQSLRRDCESCGRFIGFPVWCGTTTSRNAK